MKAATLLIVDDSVTEETIRSFCGKSKQVGGLTKVFFFGDDSGKLDLLKRVAHEEAVRVEFFENLPLRIADHFVTFRESLKSKLAEIAGAQIKGRSIREFFRLDSGRQSIWDMSLLSELNPIKSPVFHWASLLDFFDSEILQENSAEQAYVCVSEKLLLEAISICLREHSISIIGSHVANSRTGIWGKLAFTMGDGTVLREGLSGIVSCWKFLKRKLALRSSGIKSFKRSNSILLVSYFPGFSVGEDGSFRSNYVSHLQNLIEDYSKDYSLLFKVEPNPSSSYSDSLQQLKSLTCLENKIAVLEHFLSWGALVRLLGDVLRLHCSALIQRKNFRSQLNKQFNNRGHVLLFDFLWMRSFLSHVGTEAIVCSRIFNRAKTSIPKHTRVLVPSEMHAWERALFSGLKGWANTIAYPHGNPTVNYLPYFPVGKSFEAIDSIPDIFASPGKHFEKWKTNASVHYHEVEAHRQTYLTDVRPSERNEQTTKNELLIVGPGRPEEAANVLKLLDTAFSGNEELKFRYKAHPVCPLSEIEKLSGIDADELGISEIKGTMIELLSSFPVVLVPGTTVGIEAIVCGCEVIVPEWASRVQLSPLVGYESCYWKIWNRQSLEHVLTSVFVEQKRKNTVEQSLFVRENFFCLEEGLPRWKELLDL